MFASNEAYRDLAVRDLDARKFWSELQDTVRS
jgi:hypothetical protein